MKGGELTIKGNGELIKKINRALILETVRKQQPISRASIAKKLQLSRSTVSIIVDELLNKKMVVESGWGQSTKEGGRRAIELIFNPNSAYGVGVDIGGTKILMILTDLDGKIICKEKVPTSKNPQEVIAKIHSFIENTSVEREKIITMGIGVPAVVDSKNGIIIHSPALEWHQIDFLKLCREQFHFPIFINNDVNCAIYGEQWLGAGKDASDLFFLSIGTGVGSAMIVNGNLVEGTRFSAGEIGYWIDKNDVISGELNTLHSFGAFEKKVSGSALSKLYGSGEELFVKLNQGVPEARNQINIFIDELAIAIANVASLLNPEYVIIGGGVAQSMGILLNDLQQRVNQYSPIPTVIRLSDLGADTGAIGAVAYAFEKMKEL